MLRAFLRAGVEQPPRLSELPGDDRSGGCGSTAAHGSKRPESPAAQRRSDRSPTTKPCSAQNVGALERPRWHPTATKPPAKPEGTGISTEAAVFETEPDLRGSWTPNAEIPQTTDFHPAKGRVLRVVGTGGAACGTCRNRETPCGRFFPGGLKPASLSFNFFWKPSNAAAAFASSASRRRSASVEFFRICCLSSPSCSLPSSSTR